MCLYWRGALLLCHRGGAWCVDFPFMLMRRQYSGLTDTLLPFYYLPLKSKGTRAWPFFPSNPILPSRKVWGLCVVTQTPAAHPTIVFSGRFERGPLERIDFPINVRIGHYRGVHKRKGSQPGPARVSPVLATCFPSSALAAQPSTAFLGQSRGCGVHMAPAAPHEPGEGGKGSAPHLPPGGWQLQVKMGAFHTVWTRRGGMQLFRARTQL